MNVITLKITQKKQNIRALSFVITLLSLVAFISFNALAQTVPTSLNLPRIYDETVDIGDTSASIEFMADGVDSLSIELIVPINNAFISLIGPSGDAIITSDDTGVGIYPGDASLPGAEYMLPTISNPARGLYRVDVTFPPTEYKTGILATVIAPSSIQTGVIIPGEQFLVGQTSVIGMLILDSNERPITSQEPVITVTSPSGTIKEIDALDNGLIDNLDGRAGDGLYSISYEFTESGRYKVTGKSSVQFDNSVYMKESVAFVDVVEPTIENVQVLQNVAFGPNSCVSSIGLKATAENTESGLYVSSALISDANGNLLEKNVNAETFTPGIISPEIKFSSQELLDAGLRSVPLNLVQLKILNFKPESYALEYSNMPDGSWNIPESATLCAEPIDIQRSLTVTPELQDGYIGSLNFSFDINVENAGTYQTSFKITHATGDVETYGLSNFFSAGTNTLTVNIGAEQLQELDGSFTLESVLVIGGGNTAQLSVVGTSEEYRKWQYFPTKPGDLDSDGDVDRTDRAILIQERNQKVYTPGDRRDLDRNGVIDVRDIRNIMYLR